MPVKVNLMTIMIHCSSRANYVRAIQSPHYHQSRNLLRQDYKPQM